MQKEEILDKLFRSHQSFIEYINSLTEEEFSFSFQEKWTAGQQLAHIKMSLEPLAKIMFFPKFLIKRKFGTANRESRTYDALVARYLKNWYPGVR